WGSTFYLGQTTTHSIGVLKACARRVTTGTSQANGATSLPITSCRSLACSLMRGLMPIVGHGPQRLRSIEIYKGQPIFYSLGHFVFDNLQSVQGADYFAQYKKDHRV
ncbi:MAG: CapA family protein, partial [Mesorhizobium sp.]